MNNICKNSILLLGNRNIVLGFIVRQSQLNQQIYRSSSSSERFNFENDALFGPIRPLTSKNILQKSKTVQTSQIKPKTVSNVNEISSSDSSKQQLNFPLTFTHEGNFEQQADTFKLTSLISTSITKILSETMSDESKEVLNRWREAKIKELGEEGFMIYQKALFTNGKNLHKAIFEYLSGQISLENVTLPAENQGHWNSLQYVLPEIESPTVLEKRVTHPYLKYHGIVDCVCNLSGQLVVLDWKTSEKKKSSISQLYDNPLQVSAYMGAINCDPSFENQNLQKGAVIIAYESGEPADIFTFDCQKYWKLWLQRLSLFHFTNQKTEANIQ